MPQKWETSNSGKNSQPIKYPRASRLPPKTSRVKSTKTRTTEDGNPIGTPYSYRPEAHALPTRHALPKKKIMAIVIAIPSTIFGLLALCHVLLALWSVVIWIILITACVIGWLFSIGLWTSKK